MSKKSGVVGGFKDDVVMAIAVRTGEQTRQVQMVCLDELVAADDVLRRVERLVTWGAVRESAAVFFGFRASWRRSGRAGQGVFGRCDPRDRFDARDAADCSGRFVDPAVSRLRVALGPRVW